MNQLNVWQGDFGKAYTDRNVLDWNKRVGAFRHMLGALPVRRALELGCNRGHNLRALQEVFGENCELFGIEPNEYALESAQSAYRNITVLRGSAHNLPFKDGYFDLALTVGVLIHISLCDLPAVMREMARVTQRYILSVEYFAEQETVIPYRGHRDLLWKRDFLRHFRENLPALRLLSSGFWGPEDGFDHANWWLLEKQLAAS